MKHIVITAGHSMRDPGASGNGVTEAAVVLNFRNMVAEVLTRAGVEYSTDGQAGENLPLSSAIALIRPGALAVEFHCNASANQTATGVETLSGPNMLAIGGALCEAVSKALDIRNRGAKPEASGQHSRLGFVQAGGLILELFFLSNANDLAQYREYGEDAAQAVAEVLISYARAGKI